MKIDMVETKRLARDPLNLRKDDADAAADAQLLENIRVRGIVQPLLGRELGDGMVGIINGNRRLRCAVALPLERLPVVVLEGDVTPERVMAEQFCIDLQQPLSAMEQSDGLAAIKKLSGCTDSELAAKVGRLQPWVSTTLSLQRLSPALQQMLREGRMTREQAVTITSQTADPEQQQKMLKQISGLSREEVRRRNRTNANAEEARLPSARFAMPGGYGVRLDGRDLTLALSIEVLAETVRVLKHAQARGVSLASQVKVMRDTAKAIKRGPGDPAREHIRPGDGSANEARGGK